MDIQSDTGPRPTPLPPCIVAAKTRVCDCTFCDCECLATHVYEFGFCVCEGCIRCRVNPPPCSRLDDNLRGVFG